jgi:transposase InsO family protein
VFTAELWSTETNDDPDAQRGNKKVETDICRDITGKWVHVSKMNAMDDRLWWVPPAYRRIVMRTVHMNPMSAHPSEERMVRLLKERVWWRKMETDVADYVKRCHQCQLHRMGASDRPPLQERRNAVCPMQRISMDVLSFVGVEAPGRKQRVLVILDEFSRWAEAFPIAHEDAATIADIFFNQFVCRFGVPAEIITDLGGGFVSGLFTQLCKRLGINKMTTTAYRPQGNGANERVHQTLYTILRMVTNQGGRDWRAKLPHALYVYRNSYHSAIDTTPYRALLGYASRQVTFEYYYDDGQDVDVKDHIGRLAKIHKEVKERMEKVQQQRNDRMNQKKKLREYEPGDLVKFRVHDGVRSKLDPYWNGPATVIRRTGPVDYELEYKDEPTGRHPVVHAAYLKPYFEELPEEE